MDKILTVSIAAYNSEEYIREALDSLINEDVINCLEVFVIDDGGTDHTLAIAREYADRYPHSIFCVHKENGGYGSTVNYSIEHASGKFFKLLDGDDWFEKNGFKKFVNQLQRIAADIVVTPFYTCYSDGTVEKAGTTNNYKRNQDLKICDLDCKQVFGMWALTYKTELLQNGNMTLPLHCLYSDRIYATVPFAYAETIRFLDCTVYCHRVGREGQSVTRESRIKHLPDNLTVNSILYDFYETQKNLETANIKYILNKVSMAPREVIYAYSLCPVSNEILREIEGYDKKIREISPDIYHMQVKMWLGKKWALYMRALRICRYRRLGFYFRRLILPSDG